MLQLKKQQLQAEIAAITARIDEVSARETAARRDLSAWVALFAEPGKPLDALVHVERVNTGTSNIAGVTIPVYKGLEVTRAPLDLFDSPAWHDNAAETLTSILSLKAERLVLERQRELVIRELNTTSQRVNLFEKVKIPECKENIRIIRIAIGDEQTASVTRGKIAKGRTGQPQEEDAA
ncbi:MAG: V-type ATP synthase subunit D [Verrucomicrobia bacterium ADurb.Bin070]|nr:MAG: V-type ATP synthase subunit D [Verrucomicrobia bacterium ADurb.Bin070]